MSEFVEITYDGARYTHVVYSPNFLILRAETGADNYGVHQKGDVFSVLKEDVAAKPKIFRGAVGVKPAKKIVEEKAAELEEAPAEPAEPAPKKTTTAKKGA